ncbi:hypothetical protein KVR01_009282 [Diaporthe batatas]|uniref:uncharacterized protein n=1 Tax=Diaporthe batatas TaxID=748121 RepID=UPI001D043B52|nr:uncharacterized protein KVR01_009282 [Diaporthe batatas]KAG8161018.1 hypothetical protein KVR01_009282 [Diaporthe batatas]
MKSPKSLLSRLTPFLAQPAFSRAASGLLDVCHDLSIDYNGGVLSGICHGTGDPKLTSVDLNRCLGWGPRKANLGLGGRAWGLAPAQDAASASHCRLCSIVNKDERDQGVAHLLCDCDLNGSDARPEGYSLDLGGLVAVTEEGCLECLGVTGDCARQAPSPTILDSSAEQGLGGGAADLIGLRERAIPCEDSIQNYKRLLPPTYPNTTHYRCRQDHALCCYQKPARGSRFNTYFEAFQLIRGRNCVYRLHFVIDRQSLEITGKLSWVAQFCDPTQTNDWGECEGETQLDEVPDLPEDYNGRNSLEDSEELVYDDDDDDDSSEHGTK